LVAFNLFAGVVQRNFKRFRNMLACAPKASPFELCP
jgi:hypothetical protein